MLRWDDENKEDDYVNKEAQEGGAVRQALHVIRPRVSFYHHTPVTSSLHSTAANIPVLQRVMAGPYATIKEERWSHVFHIWVSKTILPLASLLRVEAVRGGQFSYMYQEPTSPLVTGPTNPQGVGPK